MGYDSLKLGLKVKASYVKVVVMVCGKLKEVNRMSSEAAQARPYVCIFRHASTGSPIQRFHGNDGAKLSVCAGKKTGTSAAEP